MNTLLMFGTRIVVLALLSYGTAFFLLQHKRLINPGVMIFQNLGLLLDITATVFMILGSRNTPFTLHGIFGYSALLVMVIDTFLIWRFFSNNSRETQVTHPLHLFARIAFAWWVIAFILGIILVILG